MGPQEGEGRLAMNTAYDVFLAFVLVYSLRVALAFASTPPNASCRVARSGAHYGFMPAVTKSFTNAGSAVACLYVESEAVSPDEIDGPWQEYNSTSGQTELV